MLDSPTIVYQKAAIALLFSLLTFLYWVFGQRVRVDSRRQNLLLGLAFFLLRILPFVVVYVILGYTARSDVPMFYDSALGALKGGVVYRDFDTAYSPLFPYITALPLLLWNTAEAITLLLLLTEGLAVWLTVRLYRSDKDVFHKAILYLLLPVPFVLSVLGGQEDILMWIFGAWALLVWQRRRDDLWTGIILGLGMVVTKAILILTLIPVFFLVKNKFRYVGGLLLVGIPSLAVMYAVAGMEFLEPIQQANDPRTPNIWTILRPALGSLVPLGQKAVNWVGLVSILGLAGYLAYIYQQKRRFVAGFVNVWVVTYAFMMVMQQSSLANYAYIYLLPMVFGVLSFDKKSHLLLLLLFNFAVVVQPAIWWGMNMPLFKSLSDFRYSWALAEYVLEIIIVGCLIAIVALGRHLPNTSPE